MVGPPQLDVLKARLDAEYSLPVEFEVSEFQLARWVSSDDRKKLDAFIAANNSGIADDVDGDPVFMAKNEFYLGYTRERAEGITFSNVKDVKRKRRRRPALPAVVLRESRDPYAAASPWISTVSGILDRPVKPDDDGRGRGTP